MTGARLLARVRDEMDYLTAPFFRQQLKELLARPARCVVLEMSEVSFCDSAGLNVLIGAWRQAHGRGAVLAVACVPSPLRNLLAMTGIDQILRIFDTVADAEAVFDG